MAQILVLDDVQEAVDAVRKVLERRGYEVVGFTDDDADLFAVAGGVLSLFEG